MSGVEGGGVRGGGGMRVGGRMRTHKDEMYAILSEIIKTNIHIFEVKLR